MRSLRPILMKLRWVNFQKSMRHEGSNERASDNVRRGGCAFRLNKKVFFFFFFLNDFWGKSPYANVHVRMLDSADRGRSQIRLNGAICF